MDLCEKVEAFIQQHGLFEAGDRVVVAVSGGPDSMVLLDLLTRLQDRLGITLHVGHLDHGIRGAESRADARCVAERSRRLGVPYTIGSEDVRAWAQAQKRSLEEGARILRYRFLDRVASEAGANKIALGHTMDDQAETVLFRLLRGSGSKGLGGMAPMQGRCFARPLLAVTRAEVEVYVSERGLVVRRDPSNEDVAFLRNRIRRDLLPLLRERFNPNVVAVLCREAEILRSDDDFVEGCAIEAFKGATKRLGRKKIVLDIVELLGYHIALRRRCLRRALAEVSAGRIPGFDEVERLLGLVADGRGVSGFRRGVRAQAANGLLILRGQPVPSFCYEVPLGRSVSIPELGAAVSACVERRDEVNDLPWRRDRRALYMDRSAIRGRLWVRTHRPGDRIQPFGMKGHKKVSDVLSDAKIPRIVRDERPLLTDDEEILWVVGVLTSEIGRIGPATSEILKVQFQGGDRDTQERQTELAGTKGGPKRITIGSEPPSRAAVVRLSVVSRPVPARLTRIQ